MIDDFKALFPEFDETFIDDMFPIYEDVYKSFYNFDYGVTTSDDKAILFLMAHLLKSSQSGSGLLATSKSDDGVSISYAVPQNINEKNVFYMSTKYGIMFNAMIQNKIGAYFV